MSTQTDWTDYDDAALEDHLERAVELADEDPDFWGDFRDEVLSEKQRRRTVRQAAAKNLADQNARKEATTPEGQLRSLKADLKAAEQELAAYDGVTSGRGPRAHPDERVQGSPDYVAKQAAGQKVATLQAKVNEATARLAFAGTDDTKITDELADLEGRAVELMSVVAESEKEFQTTGIRDPRKAAGVERARRELAEINGDLDSLRRESERRRVDKRNAIIGAETEAKTVRAMRVEALNHWTARERQLKAMLDDPTKSGMFDLGELREASKQVAQITAWNAKDPAPTKGELARARERLAQRTDIRVVGNGVEADW